MLELNKINYYELSKIECKDLYKRIIKERQLHQLDKDKVWVECHHILPKWLCKNKKWKDYSKNKVYLLPYEHFICHWLLYRFYDSTQSINAVCMFYSSLKCKKDFHNIDVYKIAKLYEETKIEIYKACSKAKNKVCEEIYKQKHKVNSYSTAGMKWWTNDKENKLAYECPGNEWHLGLNNEFKNKCKIKSKSYYNTVKIKSTHIHSLRKVISNTIGKYIGIDRETLITIIYSNCLKFIKRNNIKKSVCDGSIYGCDKLTYEERKTIVDKLNIEYYSNHKTYNENDNIVEKSVLDIIKNTISKDEFSIKEKRNNIILKILQFYLTTNYSFSIEEITLYIEKGLKDTKYIKLFKTGIIQDICNLLNDLR